jgi:hypothetical protein
MYCNINGDNDDDNMDMVNPNNDNYNFLDNMDLTYMPAKQHNNVRAETNTDIRAETNTDIRAETNINESHVTKLVNLNTQSLLEEDIDINESTYAPITNHNENQADVLDHSHDNIMNKQTVVSDSKADVQSISDMTAKIVNKADVQSINDTTIQIDKHIDKKEKFNNIHPKNVAEETENNNCLIKIVLFGVACLLAYKLYKNRKQL